MKNILLFLTVCILGNCNNVQKEKNLPLKKDKVIAQLDLIKFDSQIRDFEVRYNDMIKTIGDSVSKVKADWGDFSEFTKPLEKKYNSCTDDTEKTLLGFKLAGNYLIHYDSSKKVEYKKKAEPLFFSFLSYNNGNLASEYMKLDLKKVQYIQQKWENFSDKDRETLLFYGLLRGFNNGVPDVLKNIE